MKKFSVYVRWVLLVLHAAIGAASIYGLYWDFFQRKYFDLTLGLIFTAGITISILNLSSIWRKHKGDNDGFRLLTLISNALAAFIVLALAFHIRYGVLDNTISNIFFAGFFVYIFSIVALINRKESSTQGSANIFKLKRFLRWVFVIYCAVYGSYVALNATGMNYEELVSRANADCEAALRSGRQSHSSSISKLNNLLQIDGRYYTSKGKDVTAFKYLFIVPDWRGWCRFESDF